MGSTHLDTAFSFGSIGSSFAKPFLCAEARFTPGVCSTSYSPVWTGYLAVRASGSKEDPQSKPRGGKGRDLRFWKGASVWNNGRKDNSGRNGFGDGGNISVSLCAVTTLQLLAFCHTSSHSKLLLSVQAGPRLPEPISWIGASPLSIMLSGL